MKSLPVDDELYERVHRAASLRGTTVEEFINHTLRTALHCADVHQTFRNGLPVMIVEKATL